MITEAIIWVFSRLVAFLIGLLPKWTAPDWLTAAGGFLRDGLANVAGYANWMPLKAVGVGVGFLLACSAIALGIRFGRMILSVSTGGGGGAA